MRTVLLLVTILCLTIIVGCETTKIEPITVPNLEADISRPTLVTIPDLKIGGFSAEQIDNIVSVLSAYNTNLELLFDYSKRLEKYNKVCVEYYDSVIKRLTDASN